MSEKVQKRALEREVAAVVRARRARGRAKASRERGQEFVALLHDATAAVHEIAAQERRRTDARVRRDELGLGAG